MFNKRSINLTCAGVLMLLFSLTVLPGTLYAQEHEVTMATDAEVNLVSISGEVIDVNSRKSISNATVTIVGQEKQVMTDTEGKFSIENLSSGTFTIKVDHPGYEQLTKEVELTDQENPKQLTLELTPLS